MRLESGTVIEARALLFDMDGTLIDSRVVVEKIWKRWCDENGIDWHYVLPRLHGVRMLDSVRMFVKPGMDVDAVYERLYREEVEDVEGIVPIPGALELLASLPSEAWTIVTSADTTLAKARLGAAGIVPPPHMVTGEIVRLGKPDPEGYLLGARRMGATAEGLPGVRGCKGRHRRRPRGRCTGHRHRQRPCGRSTGERGTGDRPDSAAFRRHARRQRATRGALKRYRLSTRRGGNGPRRPVR